MTDAASLFFLLCFCSEAVEAGLKEDTGLMLVLLFSSCLALMTSAKESTFRFLAMRFSKDMEGLDK